MAYCTEDDLVTALGEIKLREIINLVEGTAVTFPTTEESSTITQAIDDADKKIDLYCSRYVVPFSGTTLNYVKQISIDFSEWNLRNDRAVMTWECENKYHEWIRVLRLVVDEKINLPGATLAT